MEMPKEEPVHINIPLTEALLGKERADLVCTLLDYLYYVGQICEKPERLNAGADAFIYREESNLRAHLVSLPSEIVNSLKGGSDA
jgi:hypothetical protein